MCVHQFKVSLEMKRICSFFDAYETLSHSVCVCLCDTIRVYEKALASCIAIRTVSAPLHAVG